jgi:hypothetical protein
MQKKKNNLKLKYKAYNGKGIYDVYKIVWQKENGVLIMMDTTVFPISFYYQKDKGCKLLAFTNRYDDYGNELYQDDIILCEQNGNECCYLIEYIDNIFTMLINFKDNPVSKNDLFNWGTLDRLFEIKRKGTYFKKIGNYNLNPELMEICNA